MPRILEIETHRFRLMPDLPYAARLLSVRPRPVENRNAPPQLLRLEFELFSLDEARREVRSLGKIASRDVIVVRGVGDDFGVAPFVQALRIRPPDDPAAWLRCAQRRPWVKLTFGEVDPADDRNLVKEIYAFACSGYKAFAYDYSLDEKWVGPRIAAQEFGVSEATIRRRIDVLEADWGPTLVRRTSGGQRRVNLPLMKHVWDEYGWNGR
ncbi:MAG: hypothetical protein KY476_17715 [Planctomycetes bacterium]|nr:hypothetical protein [Planctomycetota bacterium]